MRTLSITFFLVLISACASKPYAIPSALDNATERTHEIYVVSHGWHTGLVVPAEPLQSRLPGLKSRFGVTPNLELGWGDKGFYQAPEITLALALRALFWSSGSIIHIVAVPSDVPAYFSKSKVAKLCLTDTEYISLLDFISSSFYQNQQTEIVPIKNGIYGESQFYEGVGNYHLLNTCNSWTAKGLHSAGMDISPTFNLSAGSVMHSVQALQASCPIQVAK